MAAAGQSTWTPYNSLTQAPTNLKEAIDWVLRVTGRDGKENMKKDPPDCHRMCLLAKAVKDLLYDAGIQYSTNSTKRELPLLAQEKSIVQPVLQDLGLAITSHNGCGATEVIRTLIDHLAQGLQKWVGWRDQGNQANGTIRYCDGSGIGKKWSSGNTEQEYRSSYDDCVGTSSGASGSPTDYLWTSLSDRPLDVHLLARIFLGSVCLIWSGLSQLGFLTGNGSDPRWTDSSLYEIKDAGNAGLGSFMAAMGYDLERLNQGSGYHVWNVLTGIGSKSIKWQEFASVKSNTGGSVAEYYSSIYGAAQGAAKSNKTEDICTKYPLLVLHILASGYFRAGSAGANKISTPPTKKTQGKDDTAKHDTPRKPQSIREILYWLSALPYSQGYKTLVERMQQKTDLVTQGNSEDKKGQIDLHGENIGKTQLKRDNITHYLLAACGYCPLVLIGIQGTIEKEVDNASAGQKKAEPVRCDKHIKSPHGRCNPKEIKTQEAAQSQKQPNGELQPGEVCYGGYHLAVKGFGPLHGMYANGLFGFQMDGSPAQCLDQLRVYVYHCFYQLHFLRKQCGVGVESGAVLGWQSCRYGYNVGKKTGNLNETWVCKAEGGGSNNGEEHTKKCGIFEGTSSRTESPLQSFLCDRIGSLRCKAIIGKGNMENYPEIKDHMDPEDISPLGHLGKPPIHCPVPMGWQQDGQDKNHFKDLSKGSHKTDDLQSSGRGVSPGKYAVHCTGRTLSYLLEYYCDPKQCHGSLVVLLRLLACITPTVPRTLGDLFGFYYYIVYIGGELSWDLDRNPVRKALKIIETDASLVMAGIYSNENVVEALTGWSTDQCQTGTKGNLKCLTTCVNSGTSTCSNYLRPLTGEQYRYLAPSMAGTYLSWLVYLAKDFQKGLNDLKEGFQNINCTESACKTGSSGAGCDGGKCTSGTHGNPCTTAGTSSNTTDGVCKCPSVVSCTGVLPVLYKYGFGYGDVNKLHPAVGVGAGTDSKKKCHDFLSTLESIIKEDSSTPFKKLINEINQLIYTTRLPWIFVLTLAWLVAVLYLAFGAIWPLDWTHMRSHCRGWFRKGSLSPWEVLMVGKKKGRGILEFFGGS